ncbi:MAG: site-specific integrase [Microcoleus sp. PH2017_15_JOR_U_A]|uniref:site-specific integrase n=1 Tax=unclassified Microcoleus TaxID=2642155 RepID=UPI001DE5EAB7|nr:MULTISPECIES: tyrosine-type recombinase/integrase [unclassified Microcoleus]MCC3486521.1 site-specific integrase [Microcoleus sp. PH2017_14_LAR_D_A]MCC3499611.1 site-specific integrase [Microcoleus sp. PH2017_15_JOR_U_A]MCC3600182.1 site-specific integrase [Microcoleus sp. PH2017_26_ELK_O_A]
MRFTVEGRRFSFHPLPGGQWDSKRDRQLVAAIASRIQNDLIAGSFDPTLDRYQHKLAPNPVGKVSPIQCQRSSWLDIWDGWVATLNLNETTKADHYQCVRRMIEKTGNPQVEDTEWLKSVILAASTFNRRLSMLRSAVAWAVKNSKIATNPLEKFDSRSATFEEEEKAELVKNPLNTNEVQRVIAFFRENHFAYSPFVEFLLYTGIRTGEAVGIRWQDIDIERRLIFIKQSISRERGGSGYAKIRKKPKTLQSARSLKMSDRVFDLLVKMNSAKSNFSELVFTSPRGCIIDHGNFRTVWKKSLEGLGIPYRKPYATRHTLLSQALESGLTIPQVAAIAGHKDGRMILQHYGRVINQPQLPE